MHPDHLIYRYKLNHLLFWLALFGSWYFFRFQDYPGGTAFLVTFIKVVDLALMVYITNYVLIPRFVYRKKYAWFGVIFFLMIFTSSLYKLYIIVGITSPQQDIFDNLKVRVYDNVIPHFLLVSTGAAIKLLIDYAKAQRRIAEITKEKAAAELNFLKSQINPHFIFNSLNSVYFLIDKKNGAAREVLHKFSDMLRYQLYELNGEKISIEKELTYLKDYVELQQLRQENCIVRFNNADDVSGFFLEPLLLIPFVENSFKHISHYSHTLNEVNINVTKPNGKMIFSVSNTTEQKEPNKNEKTGGIGLTNIKRRLELLYPNQYKLDINKEEGWFNVELILEVEA